MHTRIFRSPKARYYAEDVLEGPDVYSEGCLKELTSHGFNGIWLRIRLRDACRTRAFPELGPHAADYQQRLNLLCDRAARHGVRVFLYMNEPLCLPAEHPFWESHPDVKGVGGSSTMDEWDHTFALCTSHPRVQAFLREGTAELFRACPRLGGVFIITRSEHHTHCYSHDDQDTCTCPRCAPRDPAEVIAEVNNLIAEGIHSAAPRAQVIAWNWAWSQSVSPHLEKRIIDRLTPDLIVMADFERGGRKTIAGRERPIEEYAKLQIGTTHEIATVNNLPLIPNLLGKARWLRKSKVAGTLACWNFGNRLTLNTWAFNRFLDSDLEHLSDEEALSEAARSYLGVEDAQPILNAWALFVEAFDHYPFHTHFLYTSPVNYALAYPLPRPNDPDRPMQSTWIPLRKPYGTHLAQTATDQRGHTGYTLEDYRDCFRTMAEVFGRGLAPYESALTRVSTPRAARELKNARIIHHILQSTANIYEAYILSRAEPFDETAWRDAARRETNHLKRVLPLLHGEKEIGYHSEAAAWHFTEAEVAEKVGALKQVLNRYDAQAAI